MLNQLTRLFSVVFIVSLLWFSSFLYVKNSYVCAEPVGNLSDVLFGASSVALSLVTLIIAVVALFGWQFVGKSLEKVSQETASLGNEYKGRMMSALGYFVGEVNKAEDSIGARDEHKMKEAVDLCQKGYEFLSATEGPGRFMALNNLVYYLCVYGKTDGKADYRRDFILSSADELMRMGQKKDSINLQLTACRAMVQYPIDVKKAIYAYELLGKIKLNPAASELEKKEAAQYLEAFKGQLPSADGEGATKRQSLKQRVKSLLGLEERQP